MPRGKIENDLRRVPGQLDHAPAKVGTEVRLDIIGIVLQARIDLPAVAAGGAPARLVCLQNGNIDSLLGKMERCGQACETSTDDGDGHTPIAVERWRRDGRPRGIGVEARG